MELTGCTDIVPTIREKGKRYETNEATIYEEKTSSLDAEKNC